MLEFMCCCLHVHFTIVMFTVGSHGVACLLLVGGSFNKEFPFFLQGCIQLLLGNGKGISL